MKKKYILFVLITTAVVLLLFLLNLFVKSRIETRLEEMPGQISYKDLGVNIYLNRYRLEKLQTRQKAFSLSANEVIIKNISYAALLSNGPLEIGELEVQQPDIIYYRGEGDDSKKRAGKEVRIKQILLKNGTFKSKEKDTSITGLYLSFPEVNLKPEKGDIKNFPPQSYQLHLDSVWYKMNPEHFVSVGDVKAKDGKIDINDLKIASLYAKEEFDQKIPFEKDRIVLNVPLITLQHLNLERINDTIHLGDSKTVVSEAFLEIYRNKSLPDDTTKKLLYNELLRKAAVKFNFKQVLIKNSEIIYEESIKGSGKPAVIRFTGVEAEINHLNNLKDSLPQPQITASAHFMRGTRVSLDWTFPVYQNFNPFKVSGSFGKIEGEALDPFIIPAMDMQLRGTINDISFNFLGNENVLEGTFAMDYRYLKIELLKNNGSEKKKFLSALANLLVENKGEAGTREVRVGVERDKQRSFWNFLWLGLRSGFMEIIKQL